MSVSALLSVASVSKLTGGAADDDWADRLNHLYTVVLLILFTCIVSGGQIVGNPIECWMPAHFPGTYVGYARTYCWVKNTYYIPMGRRIPEESVRRESEELTYYQWVPIILLFMALLFKLPCLFWRLLNGASALNLDKIVNMTTSVEVGSPQKRQEAVRHIALYMDRWLEAHRHYHFNTLVRFRQRFSRFLLFFLGKRDGTYLTGLYIFVKFLYVVNAVSQFFILNAFMGKWYNLYGFEVLRGITNNDSEWEESPRFPRVTLCDFDIRQLENVQRYTVQCVLPINMFNEKIFVFLWFWICWVGLLTVVSFLFWVWRVHFRRNRAAYVRKYLLILDELRSEEDKKRGKRFALNYLRDDGVFVLRLIAKNSNDILLSEIVAELWRLYCDKPIVKATTVTMNGDKPCATEDLLA